MFDDDVVRAAANCAEAYRCWVASLGRPWRAWDDLIVADMGLPVCLPPNHAALRTPITGSDVDDDVDRMRPFFDGSPGGDYQLWSVWPTPDLTPLGLAPWRPPLMIRPPGGSAAPTPPELTIAPVDDERSANEAASLLTAFGTPAEATRSMITSSMQTDGFRVWLGRVEDRPVSTAAASVSHGYVGVYAVATDPAFRGRGYGESLAWVASLFRPDLPATLQASALARPIYERMGYETVTSFHCWTVPRRPAPLTATSDAGELEA